MPIVASDIKFYKSGTSDIGGAISATEVSGALNGLFDYVTGAESAAGDVEYRCIYIKNTHATLTLYGAKVWISVNTPAAGTDAAIGLGAAALSATENAIANEGAAPAGVSFSSAATEGAALTIGDMGPGAYKALWIRRTVSAGAAAYNSDGVTITVKGDSGA